MAYKNYISKKIIIKIITTISLGRRVYYYKCRKEAGDHVWFNYNFDSAAGSPKTDAINADWLFKRRWDPLK